MVRPEPEIVSVHLVNLVAADADIQVILLVVIEQRFESAGLQQHRSQAAGECLCQVNPVQISPGRENVSFAIQMCRGRIWSSTRAPDR